MDYLACMGGGGGGRCVGEGMWEEDMVLADALSVTMLSSAQDAGVTKEVAVPEVLRTPIRLDVVSERVCV